MIKRRWALVALLSLLPLAPAVAQETTATSQPTTDEAQDAPNRFLRYQETSKDAGQLQTAIVKMQNDAGVTVRLVCAVHVADASYYHDLQKIFADSDAVLYEMVKHKDAPAPVRGQHSDSGVSKLQNFLKDQLGLSFQLDEIDYTKPNFIHADLDAETFEKLQSERGESFASLILSQLMKALADPQAMQDQEPVDMMDLMTRPDSKSQFKLILAKQMGNIEQGAGELDVLNGTVILTERNKAVTKKLQQVLKQGKKNIVIFYGAAHMPELSDRLDLMGFKPVETKWETAWNIRVDPNAPSAFMRAMSHLNDALQDVQKQSQ